MTPEEIREKDAFPAGFLPLPHPNHPEGGMLFPKFHIDEIKKQEQRDLTRFDLDFDLPDHFLPEFPPPIFLTTRPDLGDVSQGKLVTIDNFFELFNGILNPKQLEGLRLLRDAVPAAAVQPDRRSPLASGRTAAWRASTATSTATPTPRTHLVGDIRPQEFRHRIDTPSLRGVNIQRLFGSQRALKTRRGLHRVRAARRVLRRRPGDRDQEGRQHPRARQPGALHGRVPGAARLPAGAEARRRRQARSAQGERRRSCAGEELFFGKAQCATCHPAAVLHRQHDAQPADGALLQAAARSTARMASATARSRRSRCAASRTRRRTCTTAGC